VTRPPWAAFAAVSFTYFASIGFFTTYAPLWFKSLGYSALAIGVISSLQAWTRVFVPYAWGWLADHTGRRVWLLRAATLGSLLVGSLLAPAHSWGWLPLCVFLLFICNGGVVPLSESALARFLQTDGGMDAARYGRIRVWGSIGFILSVTAAGFILESAGIDAFPWVVSVLLVLLCVAAARLPSRVDAVAETTAQEGSVWQVLRQRRVQWFFATIFFTVLGHTSLYTFLSLYLDELGYGKSAVGLVWAVSVLAEITFFWMGAHWAGRLEPVRWLWWAAVLCVLRFAAIASMGHVMVVLVAAQLLHAVTFAAQHAACTAQLGVFFPGRLRGRGQALYAVLGYGLSGVLGGLGGGLLTQHLGFESVFWAATASGLMAVACAHQLARHLGDQL
jgi:PPP family 3-phenylpropionic acid transporter